MKIAKVNRKKYIAPLAALLLFAGSGLAYAAVQPEPVEPQENAVHKTLTGEEVKPTVTTSEAEPKQEKEPEPVETTPVEAPAPAPAPEPVRSFDEIILDYNNLSFNEHGITCMKLIQAEFPHWFTPDVREANIKLLASTVTSSCSAVYSPSGQVEFLALRDTGNGDLIERLTR